jgi:hypothetical protein
MAQTAETTKRVEAALGNPAFTSAEGREALDAECVKIEIRRATASPVCVLVSKKDNKVYIRQGLAPVMEASVTIRDPEMPLGTHVYIATSSDAGSLGWSVVSLPALSKSADERISRRGRESADQKTARAERALMPSTPAQALERVEFPAAVSARISELLWEAPSVFLIRP